jgi:hypothetical protein
MTVNDPKQTRPEPVAPRHGNSSRENAIFVLSKLCPLDQNKFPPTLRRTCHPRAREVGSRPRSKAAQSLSLNRVRLAYQKFRSVQLVHFGQVVSCEVEILSDRTAARLFEKPGSSLENFLDASIQAWVIAWRALLVHGFPFWIRRERAALSVTDSSRVPVAVMRLYSIYVRFPT